MLNAIKLKERLQGALEEAIGWSHKLGPRNKSNAYRSAYFSYLVGKRLEEFKPTPEAKLMQIKFKENEKIKGEWLLDAIIANIDEPFFVKKIYIAMECESDSGTKAFGIDFSKLLNVRAEEKIYLHGLHDSRGNITEEFIKERCSLAVTLIHECDPATKKWFLAFWPSPKTIHKRTSFPSLWDSFEKKPEEYKHISKVRLFEFNERSFDEVE